MDVALIFEILYIISRNLICKLSLTCFPFKAIPVPSVRTVSACCVAKVRASRACLLSKDYPSSRNTYKSRPLSQLGFFLSLKRMAVEHHVLLGDARENPHPDDAIYRLGCSSAARQYALYLCTPRHLCTL
jgi:hypothetical protein